MRDLDFKSLLMGCGVGMLFSFLFNEQWINLLVGLILTIISLFLLGLKKEVVDSVKEVSK